MNIKTSEVNFYENSPTFTVNGFDGAKNLEADNIKLKINPEHLPNY